MRPLRWAFVSVFLAAAASAVAGSACKTPTQVTIDVSLSKSNCSQTNGTAIIAAGDPAAAETRVADGYPSAVTTSCDDNSRDIGTLVLTPGDSDHGAVVVVVSFSRDHAAADCKPPLYTDCVVARRSFAFVEHQKLTLPVEIDFDCVNVPCDSTSTCKQGQCYSSNVDVTPGSDTYAPVGVQADGAAEDAVVPDAGGDATPVDDSGKPIPHCVGTNRTLFCPDEACLADQHQACVANGTSATCEPDTTAGARVCCTDVDCPSGFMCSNPTNPTQPGMCVMKNKTGPTPPYCTIGPPSDLHCFAMDGGDAPCMGTSVSCCASSPTCTFGTSLCADRMCCAPNDCPNGMCVPSGMAGVPGRCSTMAVGVPTCDGTGKTVCGGAGTCAGGSTCCRKSDNTLACLAPGDPSCTTAYCCGGAGSCGGYGTCPATVPIAVGAMPATCAMGGGGAAYCDGGVLTCAPQNPGVCMSRGCCGMTPPGAMCIGALMCMGAPNIFCCMPSDCTGGGSSTTCVGASVQGFPGTCQ